MDENQPNSAISVRPMPGVRLKLKRVAAELSQPEAKILIMCFEAIDELVENPHAMPNLVTVLKTLRTSDASFAHPKRPFKPDPFVGNVRYNERPRKKAS